MGTILEVERLTKDFSGVRALNAVSLSVREGSIHGLIGPNGSGKTTFFNCVTGIHSATSGRVVFNDAETTRLAPDAIARLGVSRTFQGGLIIPTMTCLENVMFGAHGRTALNLRDTFLRVPLTASAGERRLEAQAREILEMVGLAAFEGRWAGELVWVERQLLQFARALMARPKLLMLDEPTSGMGHEETEVVKALIQTVSGLGISIVLVSHDVKLVSGISDWITVFNSGDKIAEGPPEAVQRDPVVLEAYLGRDE